MNLTEQYAHDLDTAHPSATRSQFIQLPANRGAYPHEAYFAGNSLGLQPITTAAAITDVLESWSQRGVHGHFTGGDPWLHYHQYVNEALSRVVGALPQEVSVMNTLTVNLHLMLASFYRPTAERHQILIEDYAFPSDSYAVRSHARLRGYDPDEAILRLRPRAGEDVLRTEDVISVIEQQGPRIATLMLSGINYLTGELMDIAAITAAGRKAGIFVGWDLAHAAGNVPLSLHDWGVDFAAWCNYKYLNSGPGAVAAAFVHERHLADPDIQRLEGWYGNRLETRFDMAPIIDTPPTAEAWVLSTSPILAIAPIRASLEIFDSVGMPALRKRSLQLSDYLLSLLDDLATRAPLAIVTPREATRRGSQISIRIDTDVAQFAKRMDENWGVIPDDRKPNIIRMAPIPLYTSFHDCWRGADAVSRELLGLSIG